jgi:hypothetical protein
MQIKDLTLVGLIEENGKHNKLDLLKLSQCVF